MTNIFLSFFEISVSISLIVLVLMLLTSFLNKRYATKWKYLIWIFLALRLLVPFSGADGQSVMDMLSQMVTQTVPEPEEEHMDTPADAAAAPGRVIVEIPVQMTTPIVMRSGEDGIGITLLDIVAFVWLIGGLAFISVHFISYQHFKRQAAKKGTRIENTHILRQMSELKRELRIRRAIQMMEYSEAGSPMIIGFCRPVLVLPKEQYSPEELYFVLKHELIHLKRGDIYFKLLFVAANAVHWFNPLIWVMHKEAVVDMELSCDERVTQGADYAMRKAYTETLLSMLHKQCPERTVLSTQFYGGKEILKKRFKNILTKRGKKNGIAIWICAVIVTISLGTRIGCSVAQDDAGDAGHSADNDALAPDESGDEDRQSGQMAADDPPADNAPVESTTALTFLKEGETEQKQAALVTGDGYSLYLPEGEWQRTDSDLWTAVLNERVQIWITHFEDLAIDERAQELIDDGYVTEENYRLRKQEGNLIYNAGLMEFEDDVWGVFYCFPTDSEEGWGRELPVIADTFAVSIPADDGQS